MLISKSNSKFLKRKNSIQVGGELLDFTIPVVMGIINVTPDSFYDGGKNNDLSTILSKVENMLIEGATIIDFGAVSTRPGAEHVNTKTELERLLPVLKEIRKFFPEIIISVDTYRSWVAQRVYDEIGPFIINDISGGTLDSKIFEIAGILKVPYILTHIKGTPQTMQDNPVYEDIVKDISLVLSESVKKLIKFGVSDIIIDPGFGFGKTIDHNFELLNRLDSFKVFQLPLMVGLSRKSMVWKALEVTPEESLNGTTIVNTMALMGGADILRVHDVKEAMETVKLFLEIKASLKQ